MGFLVILLLLVLIVAPFFATDFFIIYFTDSYYNNIGMLFLFLILIYGVAYLFDNILGNIFKVVTSRKKEYNLSIYINIIFGLSSTISSILLLDYYFDTISLTSPTVILIAIFHTILFLIIDQLPE